MSTTVPAQDSKLRLQSDLQFLRSLASQLARAVKRNPVVPAEVDELAAELIEMTTSFQTRYGNAKSPKR